jgi:3-dehydroquinate synthase II/3-amino-4-hydroxybenzoic acid synthase
MQKELWLDARDYSQKDWQVMVELATNNGYSAVLFLQNQLKYADSIPKSVKKMIYLNENEDFDYKSLPETVALEDVIVFSKNIEVLNTIKKVNKGLYISVNDKASLDETVEKSNQYKHIIIDFLCETNIPLELVLAFSQKNNCKICKKVNAGKDGWIASMVMEMGCHEVLLKTTRPEDIVDLKVHLESLEQHKIDLQELTVISSKHIGMGDRVCIDTTSLLKEDEGFILGSTSQGGILVSSETHFLPYMELRPFRVNAGGIHLYAWNMENKTDYLSELKAGSGMMAVDSEGNVRKVAVGRIKIERRPLLLIEAKDDQGREVNVILQDDWHVRVIGPKGVALNCTELKAGDKVMGYTCAGGRHVGIKIDENIIEK